MNSTVEQRRLLGAFLRARRERLTPAEARILGGSTRRRTPGLRREEVAQLCGLSPTWYTWLEQGRDVSVSPRALARVAEAMRLTAAERAYLFELTRKRDPEAATDAELSGALPASLISALKAITEPAYVLDRNWLACGWNPPAERLFTRWLGGPERNLLRYVFFDASAREFICDWEDRARRLVAEFRADTVGRVDDDEVTALVEELCRSSPRFAEFWNDHSVLTREGGVREFRHPEAGALRYEQITFVPAVRPGYKFVMLVRS
jgi:transcriptional regulator with XRE-family HTH domain